MQQEVPKLLDHSHEYQNLFIKQKPRGNYF